ncbi:MAG: hypothetical protein ACRD8U_22850, partial [Pyrinomonadaceae bacterium]
CMADNNNKDLCFVCKIFTQRRQGAKPQRLATHFEFSSFAVFASLRLCGKLWLRRGPLYVISAIVFNCLTKNKTHEVTVE